MGLLALAFALGLGGTTSVVAQMTGGCSVSPAVPAIPVSQRGVIVKTPNGGVTAGVPGSPGRVPYSLVRMITQVQTLGNGVRITSRSETREWHDAEGRQRTEVRVERNGEMQLQNVSINDPVARENIILYSKAQVAQVLRYPAPTGYQPSTGYQPRPVDKAFQDAMKAEYQPQPQRTSQIENKNETLEPTVIAGQCAQGNRWTQSIPTGVMGNDGEIRTVSENWMLPRLGIQLRFVQDDPRTGHLVNEVTELHLEAPDPSVFQPPPEYQVFDLTRDPAKP